MMVKAIYNKYRALCLKVHNGIELFKVTKGKNNNVFGKIDIVSPENLVIGNDCSFNHGCYIHAGNGIRFGNDVTLSAHSCVVSTGIDYRDWANGNKHHVNTGKIDIGNHVWVGANAIILPGASIIGEYVIVAANSVVNTNIEDSYCIVAGNPAKVVKHFKNSDILRKEDENK